MAIEVASVFNSYSYLEKKNNTDDYFHCECGPYGRIGMHL